MSDEKIEITEADKQKAAESLKTVPYARLLGFELIDLSANQAKIKLQMRDELRQPYGILHGGATASLIDTAMAFAVKTCVAEDVPTTTIDLTVHYLRPVSEGEILCTARIVRAGKRILTISAEVVNTEGKLIATALSTYMKV
ncbi:MAG: PaaI family thioesterase [Acidobacteria bacterium]|jgi:acyl-CoA thioesterase|nr:PaaI family thioesterase [Acidobacteriota bacterium]